MRQHRCKFDYIHCRYQSKNPYSSLFDVQYVCHPRWLVGIPIPALILSQLLIKYFTFRLVKHNIKNSWMVNM